MKSDDDTAIAGGIALYALSGVATSPDFMLSFMRKLAGAFQHAGYPVCATTLFPYGDWTNRITIQLSQVTRDLRLPLHRRKRSLGGKLALREVEKSCPEGWVPLLIGHSAGGIAAVHAAELLAELGRPPMAVVQIGSPKCPVAPQLIGRVIYISGTDEQGRRPDPVTRIGTWGGWERRGRRKLPLWNRRKYAPERIRTVPIIGGHRDYFRESSGFKGKDGAYNIECTLEAVWSELVELLAEYKTQIHPVCDGDPR
ncbi:hypothetical protein [Paenibacillus turpanensis]|uniref:hypothetical protein n=1 Tax=Paenibacillus turpanensis TaxID=2689078 RepID=UPI0014073C4C|nr:hypothetical protein [Paenibacillus turpanensis]